MGLIRLLSHIIFLLILIIPASVTATEITKQRQQELKHLIKHDCGSCHGMTLKGGLGSSLTAEKLDKFPDDLLVNIVMNGVTGTPMPPWKDILSQKEVVWMIKQLKEGTLENN
jgi:cytochrome c55X